MSINPEITVLGIGNIIVQDEGFGVTVVEELQKEYDFPDNVQVIDGGTLGAELMYFIEGTKKLIVIDAINGGAEPGTFFRFADDEVQAYFQDKVSMHELGVQDVLAALQVTGKPVESVVIMGAQPYSLGAGVGLTEPMASLVGKAKELVLQQLKDWQAEPARKMAIAAGTPAGR